MNQGMPSNPFVGLRPFRNDESLLFFGRREQTTALLQKLYETRFLAVVGSSGCGKSSLIRAGLIPKLKAGFLLEERDRWFIATMKPGDRPLYNFAASLRDAGLTEQDGFDPLAFAESLRASGARAVFEKVSRRLSQLDANLLLLVDQFEEIFRFGKNAGQDSYRVEKTDFVSIMLSLVKQQSLPVYTVMTIRSDFIGDCDAFFGLPEAMNRSQYLVPRLTRQQKREVIEGPVRLFRGDIDPRLTDELLNSAEEVADGLPVLQHVMMRTWECADKGRPKRLDITAYECAGEIRGALSRHANESMKGMDDRERDLTKKIFQALTDVDERSRHIRRPVHLSEIRAITGAAPEKILEIINRFQEGGRSFLVISEDKSIEDPIIDISHEALIRQWQTLKDWVEEEVASGRRFRRLATRAVEYYNHTEDLLRGPGLKQNWKWHQATKPNQAWSRRYHDEFKLAIRFLKESKDAYEDELVREEEKRRLEKERSRKELEQAQTLAEERQQRIFEQAKAATRLRFAIIFVSLGLILSTVLGIFAFTQYTNADERQKSSRLHELLFFANANLESDPTLSFRLAEASLNIEPTVRGKRSLWAAFNLALPTILKGHVDSIEKTLFFPDGSKILTISDDQTARIWDAVSGRVLHTLIGHKDDLEDAAISIDGSKILTRHWVEAFCIWDAASGRQTHMLNGLDQFDQAVFSPDGSKILTFGQRTVSIFDAEAGKLRHVLIENKGSVEYDALFSPDGNKILTFSRPRYGSASKDYTVQIWDSESGRPLHVFEGQEKEVVQAVFSPDSSKVITASKDKSARIWDAESGKMLLLFKGEVNKAVFSPDGNKVLTVSKDNTARIWDAESDTLLLVLEDKTKQAAFSPDGSKILSLAIKEDAQKYTYIRLYILDATSGRALWWLSGYRIGPIDQIDQAVFSPDGSKVLTIDENNRGRIWDAETGRSLQSFKGRDLIHDYVFSPDGSNIATRSAYDKNLVYVWKMKSGKQLYTLKGHKNGFRKVLFSPDGSKLLTASGDNTVRIWDAESGKSLHVLAGHQGAVRFAVFSPDSSKAVTASTDNTAHIWDAESGKSLHVLIGHKGAVRYAIFSPDSSKVFTASEDKTARIWDAESGKMLLLFKGEVNKAVFSPDGSKIITAYEEDYQYDSEYILGSDDNPVRIWDADSGKPHHVLRGHKGAVRYAAIFSPDGSKIFTGSDNEDGSVRTWDVASDRWLYMPRDIVEATHAIFSPDGSKIAITTKDGRMYLWDVVMDQKLKELEKTERLGRSSDTVFSPDGSKIVLTTYDEAVYIWDVVTGRMLYQLGDPMDEVTKHAFFSPDGSKIVIYYNIGTSPVYNTMDIWETLTGKKLDTFVHQGNIKHASFSPDGSKIITVSNGGIARIWPGNYKSILKAINDHKIFGTIRQLTEMEKKDYGFK